MCGGWIYIYPAAILCGDAKQHQVEEAMMMMSTVRHV